MERFRQQLSGAVQCGYRRRLTIISNSWAYCEDQTTLADVQSIDSIFQSAAVSNISIFNGAGDSGARV